MIFRVTAFILGFLILVSGLFYIISYSNLFTFGLSTLEYFIFISKRVECYYSIIGLIIMIVSLYWRDKK